MFESLDDEESGVVVSGTVIAGLRRFVRPLFVGLNVDVFGDFISSDDCRVTEGAVSFLKKREEILLKMRNV